MVQPIHLRFKISSLKVYHIWLKNKKLQVYDDFRKAVMHAQVIANLLHTVKIRKIYGRITGNQLHRYFYGNTLVGQDRAR